MFKISPLQVYHDSDKGPTQVPLVVFKAHTCAHGDHTVITKVNHPKLCDMCFTESLSLEEERQLKSQRLIM